MMNNELPLPPYTRQWLGLIAASAGIHPHHDGERWLLHLTPSYPGAKTITAQIRWHSAHWQLLSISNAGDWSSMSQVVDEICIDPSRRCFWRCQAGPVTLTERPRVLASFLADMQRVCTNHGFVVEHESLHDSTPK
ncbi:hypothetical protein [Aeromonas bivalvium]|uniref:hypothetical protein n=1 Tax=Aeromonas bivalvium TaxID=440079 RepID=UPI0038D06362